MDCCRNNMSMTSTRNNNVSIFVNIMDTFSERIHDVDMKEQITGIVKPGRTSLTYLCILCRQEDISYDGMPQRNLAVEMLRKLLDGEVKRRSRKNIVQGRSFAEMVENTIRRYQARAIEAAQVIEELIALAKDMREADRRGEAIGLTEDEVAFYDALETNDSAVKVLGDETLRTIAQELLKTIRNNVTIDWTVRENVRAQMRVMIKRILRRYGYPPDKQARATELVLEQAEVLSRDWTEKV